MSARRKLRATKAKPGVWFPIGSRWHKEVCCDCGLAHKVEIGVNVQAATGMRPRVSFWQRAWRDESLTKRMRAKRRYECKPKVSK